MTRLILAARFAPPVVASFRYLHVHMAGSPDVFRIALAAFTTEHCENDY
jgi:hypothetical protein